MDRPTRVKVGPVDYNIEWHDAPWRDVYSRNGHVNHGSQVMAFSTELHSHRLAVTFLHEVCHAIYDESALTQDRTFDDEHAAEMYSGGIVAFWRDNPEAFKWWIGLVAGADGVIYSTEQKRNVPYACDICGKQFIYAECPDGWQVWRYRPGEPEKVCCPECIKAEKEQP